MKEITRIHIAKVPYDIEISAKREIEKYINDLELYAEDKELLQDIEIRITELLLDRGIAANGIITAEDVSSIRVQLGEPKDFLGDDHQPAPVSKGDEVVERKLYRNVDSAVLGGVLSGAACYFKVDSIWLRLIFIVMLFFSAGTVLLAYLILWIVIPPAKTATEKLQMHGRSVTLDSIRELNENGQSLAIEYKRASAVRRIIMLIIGVFLLGASVMTLIFTVFVAFGIGHYEVFGGILPGAQWAYVIAYILAIIAGILLSALFAVCAYIAFSLNINKRLIISVVTIVIAGLASFGTAVGLVSYQSIQMDGQVRRNLSSKTVKNPSGFKDIKNMTVNVKSFHVKYEASDNYRIEYQSLPNDEQPKISVNNAKLTIDYSSRQSARWPQFQPTLIIYGPKLDSLSVKEGDVEYSSRQENISIETVGDNSSVNLKGGVFNNLKIDAKDSSTVAADNATVENVFINSQTGSDIELGTVKTLEIVQSEACPADITANINVQSVSLGTIKYNGKDIKAEDYSVTCGSIDFDNI